MMRSPPRSTLFPCTTLFRSGVGLKRVEVLLDGKTVGEASYGQPSPGTATFWRISTDPNHPKVGFSAHINAATRSEEHTSELQSLAYLVCRLLLEKKKKTCRSRRGAARRDGFARGTEASRTGARARRVVCGPRRRRAVRLARRALRCEHASQ